MNPVVTSAFALGGLGVVRLLGTARLRAYDRDLAGLCASVILATALVAFVASVVLLPQMWERVYTLVMSAYAGGR